MACKGAIFTLFDCMQCQSCRVKSDDVTWVGQINDAKQVIVPVRLCSECLFAENRAGNTVFPMTLPPDSVKLIEEKIMRVAVETVN